MATTRKRPHLPRQEKGGAAEDTPQASAAPVKAYHWQQWVRDQCVDVQIARKADVDPQTVKAVWVLISTYVNGEGQADMSQKTLGRQIAGVDDDRDHTRAVRRAIKVLRDMGVLDVRRRGGIDPRTGSHRTAVYTLVYTGQRRPVSDGWTPDSEAERPDGEGLDTGRRGGGHRTELRPSNGEEERSTERLLETSAAARATADGKRGQVIAFPQSSDSRSSGSTLPAVPNPHKGTPDTAMDSGQGRPVYTPPSKEEIRDAVMRTSAVDLLDRFDARDLFRLGFVIERGRVVVSPDWYQPATGVPA